MGLSPRRLPRLLTARQTDRQRLHQGVQRTLPAECLNAHWFLTLEDAAEKLEAWRRDYNEVRPHGPKATSRRSR